MNKPIVLGLVAVGMVLTLSGSKGFAGGTYAEGEAIFNNKCAMCHGHSGDGKGLASAAFNPRPSDWRDQKFWQHHTEKDIAETIKHGRGQMAATNLSKDEIKAVIDYMLHTFKKQK